MGHHALMKTQDWENESAVNYSFLVRLLPHHLMLHVSPSSTKPSSVSQNTQRTGLTQWKDNIAIHSSDLYFAKSVYNRS